MSETAHNTGSQDFDGEERRVCVLQTCDNELTKSQKKYCSKSHYHKQQSIEARKKGNKTGPVKPAVGTKPSGGGRALTPQQEKFCQLYASHREFFGNGVQSYIKAYDIDVGQGEGQQSYNSCRSTASEMLTNPNILARVNEIFEERGLNDMFVDKQLLFLITQHADLRVKLEAIKEYNRMRGRTNKDEKQDIALAMIKAAHERADRIGEERDKNENNQ